MQFLFSKKTRKNHEGAFPGIPFHTESPREGLSLFSTTSESSLPTSMSTGTCSSARSYQNPSSISNTTTTTSSGSPNFVRYEAKNLRNSEADVTPPAKSLSKSTSKKNVLRYFRPDITVPRLGFSRDSLRGGRNIPTKSTSTGNDIGLVKTSLEKTQSDITLPLSSSLDPEQEDELLYNSTPEPVGKKLRSEAAVHETQGKRPEMEDVHQLHDDLESLYPQMRIKGQPLGDSSFYGVYDGHSGRIAAEKIKECLLTSLFDQPSFFEEANFEKAVGDSYRHADQLLLQDATGQGWGGGAVVATVLRLGGCLIVANAGDCEVVLGRQFTQSTSTYRAVVLSNKHRPTEISEKWRIEKAGGMIFKGRLFGALAVSRGLGDFEYKRPKAAADYVTADPAIKILHLKPQDSFVVVACDGLWDVVNHKEAVQVVASLRKSGGSPQDAARSLVELASSKHSSDNITVIVIFLNWLPE